MITLKDAVPCCVCGSLPRLDGSAKSQSGRLVCPNYKSKKIQHGNLNLDTNGIPMGFTNWYHYFWNEEQMINEGIPMVVNEWNSIHKI